ncbi:hypothetical protein GOBAR_AA36727 [Gossypium barbadense]|uniref:Uncharacterized protein n=1 Tax=Gossypium barbadense TaxID=3634 RepID=A0A2P5VYU9_GOSBA|nr:hypothetical protein GOBAR_AA36727 [Gossypium barbadense]
MLKKFISMSETRFQNTETTLKNQQESIQGLETQIGQLAKLISERPQGSVPSNTKSNPREQLNTITIQYEEGLVETEPELRQEIVETHSKRTHEPYSSNNKEPIYEERRLQIEELDECIFPYGTVEVIHPKFDTFKELTTPLEKVLHDYHVLLDHHDNLSVGHWLWNITSTTTEVSSSNLIIALVDYSSYLQFKDSIQYS